MNQSQLQPYLNFDGNCEEAMKFYQSIFGGKLEISHFSDFSKPGEEAPKGVMHSTLDNGQLTFMASDGMPGRAVTFGDSVNMSLAGDDVEQLTGYFNGLAEGGDVFAPLEKQVWGDIFGMVTDKYGIHWLVNIGHATKQ